MQWANYDSRPGLWRSLRWDRGFLVVSFSDPGKVKIEVFIKSRPSIPWHIPRPMLQIPEFIPPSFLPPFSGTFGRTSFQPSFCSISYSHTSVVQNELRPKPKCSTWRVSLPISYSTPKANCRIQNTRSLLVHQSKLTIMYSASQLTKATIKKYRSNGA
jgi:hypothetical protein